LVGRGASSFFDIFCLRLSLLAARVGLSASSSVAAERLAVGVLPRAVRDEAMLGGGGALVWACEVVLDEVIDDAELLERAACGVGDVRVSMAGGVYASRPTAAGRGW
jgi:hypothetical protein